ncbi:MAG: hypothetical protein Q8P02_03270 [Candidatus Micrarchaeota archaeon]|nr:hypothetical protein [Candidatus Micrarchaeota archaeon]
MAKAKPLARNAVPHIQTRRILVGIRGETATGFHQANARAKAISYVYSEGHLLNDTRQELMKRRDAGLVTHFLDVGAARAAALRQAADLHESIIRPHGMALNRRPAGITHPWYRRRFEHTVFPDFFDVIQSCWGIHHAGNYSVAVENLANSLAKNGALILHFPDVHPRTYMNRGQGAFFNQKMREYRLADEERRRQMENTHEFLAIRRMYDVLESQGFQVPSDEQQMECFSRKGLGEVSLKIVRKATDSKANLSELYSNAALNVIPLKRKRKGWTPQ